MPTILVIDDTYLVGEAICNWVRSGGHEAIPAANADRGIELAMQISWDVAIIDGRCPNEGDGERVAMALKGRGKLIGISVGPPIAGVDIFFDKGALNITDLLSTINQLLAQQSQ